MLHQEFPVFLYVVRELRLKVEDGELTVDFLAKSEECLRGFAEALERHVRSLRGRRDFNDCHHAFNDTAPAASGQA
jgi:hypothetical protein